MISYCEESRVEGRMAYTRTCGMLQRLTMQTARTVGCVSGTSHSKASHSAIVKAVLNRRYPLSAA